MNAPYPYHPRKKSNKDNDNDNDTYNALKDNDTSTSSDYDDDNREPNNDDHDINHWPNHQAQQCGDNKGCTNANANANASATPLSSSRASALIISASAKAGMDGIDRQRIDEIILRESSNTKYFLQQQRRDDKVNQRIDTYKRRIQQAQAQAQDCSYNSASVLAEIDKRLLDWQRKQPSRTTCVVVDMDMFYMACELLDKPHLQNVPACVGSGIILTSNYVARKYGVRSAMPGWIGDKLVQELTGGKQQLVHVPSNFTLYKEKSKQTMSVLREFDPQLKSYSLDEAYLNMGPYLALYLQQLQKQLQRQRHYCEGEDLVDENDDDNNYDVEEIDPNTMVVQPQHQEANSKRDSNSIPTIDVDTANASYHYPTSPGWNHLHIQKLLHAHANAKDINDDNNNSNDFYNHSYKYILQSFSPLQCRQALERIVQYMRKCVQVRTGGLTCSAGIAPNVSLAKIASDKNKPNGQCYVDASNQAILDFVRPLMVRKIPGIGRVTEKILIHACQIQTVQDLYHQRGLVHWLFPPATREFLLRASVGCNGSGLAGDDNTTTSTSSTTSGMVGFFGHPLSDPATTTTTTESTPSTSSSTEHQKGISRERTFSPNDNWNQLNSRLQDIAYKVSKDMMQKNVWAKTITVKVKLDNFDVWSRSKTLERGVYVQNANDILEIAAPMFLQIQKECRAAASKPKNDHKNNNNSTMVEESNGHKRRWRFSCRLLGIRCSNLVHDQEVTNAQQETIDKFLKASAPLDTLYTSSASSLSLPTTKAQSATTPSKAIIQPQNDIKWPMRTRTGPMVEQDIILTNKEKEGTVAPVVETVRTEQVQCPICHCCTFLATDNDALNQHIDTCLNGSTVRKVVREDCTSLQYLSKNKRQRLTDFWST